MNQLAAMFDDTEQNEEEEKPKDKKKAERLQFACITYRTPLKEIRVKSLEIIYSTAKLLSAGYSNVLGAHVLLIDLNQLLYADESIPESL